MDESFATPENTPVAATSAREEATARPRNSIPLILVHPSSPTSITSPPNPELWWKLRKRTHDMLIPKRPVGKPPGVLQCLRSIICASWLNILLICIPVSWALHWAPPGSNFSNFPIFIFSTSSIIPLVNLLGVATDELSLRVGKTLSRLINATLGNAVGLIFAITALIKCELRVVQASLVGSILSNLLLVLGTCFLAGGLKYSEQGFSCGATQLTTSLLTISVIPLLLPVAFYFFLGILMTDEELAHAILAVSHGVAFIILFIYGGYLAFQLYSHTAFYEEHRIHSKAIGNNTSLKFNLHRRFRHREDAESAQSDILTSPLARVGTDLSATSSSSLMTQLEQLMPLQAHVEFEEPEEEEEETPQLSLWMAIGLLVAVAILVAITAEWIVESIDGLTSSGHISKEFVGIILLPIVGNAAEQIIGTTVLSVKDNLTITLETVVGSTIQIMLGVIPSIVILGWILGKPLTFLLDPYESIAMFLSIIAVNCIICNSKSNWLKGLILICLYFILALTFWFYPGPRIGPNPFGSSEVCT